MEDFMCQVVPSIRSKAAGVGKRALSGAARRRLVRAVPVLGVAFAAFHAAQKIREKGYVRGAIDVALDLTPVVGRAKAVYEFFRGDIIGPDLDRSATSRPPL
jgi:hypothetical protein